MRIIVFEILLLLLFTEQQNQASAGCAEPTVLCCMGMNETCNRGCFCDEFCMQIMDCCTDYNQTCRNGALKIITTTTTTKSTAMKVATDNTTIPAKPNYETTINRFQPEPKSTESQTPQSLTPGLTSSPNSENTDHTPYQTPRSGTSTTGKKDMRTTLMILEAFSHSKTDGKVTLESLQKFAAGMQEMLRKEIFKDCTVKILQIQPKK